MSESKKTSIERVHVLLLGLSILTAGVAALLIVPLVQKNQVIPQNTIIPTASITLSPTLAASKPAELKATASSQSAMILTDRIQLMSPTPGQLMIGSTIKFKGLMKNFDEGAMSVRLKNAKGELILTDTIQARDDNYSDFAAFDKEVNFVRIPQNAGAFGTWEIYEISPKDGIEKVLMQIPVRFPL